MDIHLKKKILKICTSILLILVIFSLFVNGTSKNHKDKNISLSSKSSKMPDCITLEESKFFKKYTIKCSNELKDVDYNNKGDNITINIKKSDMPNINKINTPEAYIDKNDSKYIFKFKKHNKNENYVSIDKLDKKSIIVLISKMENPYKYKVVVDPGHGGIDPGCGNKNIYEKNLTLKISLFMEDYLRFNGCEPVYTRKTDKYIDYHKIPQFTKDADPNIFVSIHINSNNDKSCQGLTTYYYNSPGAQSDKSTQLAKAVEKEIAKDDSWQNRGIIKNNYAVISHNSMPSILVECGFITNDKDYTRLSNDEVLNNLAKNISSGIINYLEQKN